MHKLGAWPGNGSYYDTCEFDRPGRPAVIAQTISIYFVIRYIFTSVVKNTLAKIIKRLSPLVFGIYLIHLVFLDILRGYTTTLYTNATIAAIGIEVIVTFALSAAVCFLILKIPYFRYVIG